LGYATTVHSAQGVTADTTHAILGENTTRSMLYVAMTRARDANTAYLYERTTELEHGPTTASGQTAVDGPHVLQRGISQQAGLLVRTIIEAHDDVPVTAHQVAATTPRHLLLDRVAGLLERRSTKVLERSTAHTEWHKAVDGRNETIARERTHGMGRSRSREQEQGMEL
jgi:ATP-dependent exoDNAse (exonuclease V) beta subunit